MNTAPAFDGSAITTGDSVSSYIGASLYIRRKAIDDGAPESTSTEPKNGWYNAAAGCVGFTTLHLSQYLM